MHKKEIVLMASLLERFHSSSRSQRQRWNATPRAMRIIFYAAVFSFFASIRVLSLLMSTTYLSSLEILLNIVGLGGLAVAVVAVVVWQSYRLIPVLGIFGILLVAGAAYSEMGSQLIAAGSPMHRQLEVLGNIGTFSMMMGYAFFFAFYP
jgi:hypothetical protein